MRKAQGIEMNVIIMAAVALLVIVVLIAILTDKVQIVGKESQCVARGGVCMIPEECSFARTAYTCRETSQICCMDPSRIS